jgi:hypothetical protein
VLKEITELLPFQHAPWTDRRLEGLIDFEPLTLAPGTRSGVVPDAAFEALVAAAAAIEADLAAALTAREQAETERASRQLLKQVHKAFASALAELPAEEYVYFDIPKPGGDGTGMPGEPLATDGAKAPGDAGREPADQPLLFPPEPGPLHAVRIAPRHPRRPPGGTARLTARASDAAGVPITAGVAYAWQLVSGEAAMTADGPTCTVTQSEAGVATVTVTAVQGDANVTDQVEVRFAEGAGDDDGPSQRGLPSYRLEAEHGQPWRSRYDQRHNEIVINSAHRDFLASRVSPAKHRRYIGKLYAKEVVLSNFPHESPAQALERLVEITLRTEDSL